MRGSTARRDVDRVPRPGSPAHARIGQGPQPQGLIRSTVDGPEYLTGGDFGVESSVLALILCTATGIVMLVMAARRGRIVPPVWKRAD